MIFRNGYISGFIDSLLDSLEITQQYNTIVNSTNLLNFTIDDTSSFNSNLVISLPLCFIYLENPTINQNENNTGSNMLSIEEANAYAYSLVLLDKFNQAASDLGVTFILASKAKADEDPLNYPGTIVHDMSAEYSIKSYIGPLEGGGFGDIEEYQYYKDHGIAAASYDNLLQNELDGVSKDTIDNIVKYYVSNNSVFTVVLCNKLNLEKANATYYAPSFSFMSGVHPFLYMFKTYYGILPYYMFQNDDVGDISSNLFDNADPAMQQMYEMAEESLVNSHTMLKNFIGSMFGLLNPGISNLPSGNTFLIPSCTSEEGDCFVTNYGVTGGDCCDDTPQISYPLYWQNILQYDTWDSVSECNGEEVLDRNNISSHVSNPMNFIDASIDENIEFTNDQKVRVQKSFLLPATQSCLYKMRNEIGSYITTNEYAPIFCSEELGREFISKIKNKIQFPSILEESKKFEKIKNKIINLCTNV